MRLDPKKATGGWTSSDGSHGFFVGKLQCYANGELLPDQEHLMEPVVPEPVVEELPPVPADPGYAPRVRPKVYLTQMNMRQLRAECVELGIPFTPGEGKKPLIAKIRESRK